MSKEQTSSPVVQSREQELEAKLRLIKRRSRTHRVGNLVLLTNKNNEDKSNAHGGIVLDQEFLIEIMRDFGFSDDVLNGCCFADDEILMPVTGLSITPITSGLRRHFYGGRIERCRCRR